MKKTHGMSNTDTYHVWQAMKARCTNANNKQWHDYGGRGIIVCPEWLVSFEAFFDSMGECPKGFCIERINNDGNYEPDNCKWASRLDNNKNKRNTIKIKIKGEELCLKDAAKKMGLNYSTAKLRISRMGWTPIEAVMEPVSSGRLGTNKLIPKGVYEV